MVRRSPKRTRLEHLLPAAAWGRRYTRGDLQPDVAAGLVAAVLQIPQAMAYAALAGLPPQVGLYASVAAPIAYALFASSRTLAIGPVAIAAVMVAEALAAPEVRGHGSAVGNALVLALESGLILLLLAALRLGAMVDFLSRPVLSGFTSGAAILILLTQLAPLLGIPSSRALTGLEVARNLYDRLDTVEPATMLLGLVGIALLALADGPVRAALRRRGAGRWTRLLARAGPLLVVVLAILAVSVLDLDRTRGVATIGPIPPGLPSPDLSFLRLGTWVALFPSAVLIALVSYISGISLAKTLASRQRLRVSPNQELTALGMANVTAAFTGGMPVAGSFSRTMVSFAAGARTQLATVVASAAIALTLLFLAPWFTRLPNAALAAIIVVAVIPLVDVRVFGLLWRYQRTEAAVLSITLAAVLLFGVTAGLVVGLLISLTAHIWRTSHPHVAVVGRVPDTEHFRNVVRHEVETWPRLALIRVDESLSFANIARVEDFITAHLVRHPEVQHLVLVCSAVNDIDSTALESLERLFLSLREAGVTAHLAEVKGAVWDALERSGLPARMAPGKIFFRTEEAVNVLTADAAAGEDGAAPQTNRV